MCVYMHVSKYPLHTHMHPIYIYIYIYICTHIIVQEDCGPTYCVYCINGGNMDNYCLYSILTVAVKS